MRTPCTLLALLALVTLTLTQGSSRPYVFHANELPILDALAAYNYSNPLGYKAMLKAVEEEVHMLTSTAMYVVVLEDDATTESASVLSSALDSLVTTFNPIAITYSIVSTSVQESALQSLTFLRRDMMFFLDATFAVPPATIFGLADDDDEDLVTTEVPKTTAEATTSTVVSTSTTSEATTTSAEDCPEIDACACRPDEVPNFTYNTRGCAVSCECQPATTTTTTTTGPATMETSIPTTTEDSTTPVVPVNPSQSGPYGRLAASVTGYNLTMYFELLNQTGLLSIIEPQSRGTLFVPTDEAFALYGQGFFQHLVMNQPNLLRDILLNHFALTQYTSLQNVSALDMLTDEVAVTLINGIPFLEGSVEVLDGPALGGARAVYVINLLLVPNLADPLPTTTTTPTTIQATTTSRRPATRPQTTTARQAITTRAPMTTAAPGGPSAQLEDLVNTSPLSGYSLTIFRRLVHVAGLDVVFEALANATILIPTDAAFEQRAELIAYLELPANRALLRSILLHHIVPRRIVTFANGNSTVQTLMGDLEVLQINGVVIIDDVILVLNGPALLQTVFVNGYVIDGILFPDTDTSYSTPEPEITQVPPVTSGAGVCELTPDGAFITTGSFGLCECVDDAFMADLNDDWTQVVCDECTNVGQQYCATTIPASTTTPSTTTLTSTPTETTAPDTTTSTTPEVTTTPITTTTISTTAPLTSTSQPETMATTTTQGLETTTVTTTMTTTTTTTTAPATTTTAPDTTTTAPDTTTPAPATTTTTTIPTTTIFLDTTTTPSDTTTVSSTPLLNQTTTAAPTSTTGIGGPNCKYLDWVCVSQSDFPANGSDDTCPCTAECGGGFQLFRKFVLPGSDPDCPSLFLKIECNTQACPTTTPRAQTSSSTSRAPDTTTRRADTTTRAPDTTTRRADTTTRAPDTTTRRVDTTTRAPDTTTQRMETTTRRAETTTRRAETTTRRAETTTRRADTTARPATTTSAVGTTIIGSTEAVVDGGGGGGGNDDGWLLSSLSSYSEDSMSFVDLDADDYAGGFGTEGVLVENQMYGSRQGILMNNGHYGTRLPVNARGGGGAGGMLTSTSHTTSQTQHMQQPGMQFPQHMQHSAMSNRSAAATYVPMTTFARQQSENIYSGPLPGHNAGVAVLSSQTVEAVPRRYSRPVVSSTRHAYEYYSQATPGTPYESVSSHSSGPAPLAHSQHSARPQPPPRSEPPMLFSRPPSIPPPMGPPPGQRPSSRLQSTQGAQSAQGETNV
ncbi:uncharacterized protein MONBRDRAFT_29153 [Monosiga brevicollis MX1]|uniref:FAS1 domain-containing protein n=1 Tax=Monosiga brevicollis TaxID=81824 RepID=A9VA98_MONBE|nr:uncharacterized protein MONBRDRAFT_29153 [Monosiga brevicollis MX1]EDQ85449.1 predicted protein [Monosiga brevicollis MX1]|eukprot:XP_001749640.1 hypothetical protein [Monosiga brevicollis MX1]